MKVYSVKLINIFFIFFVSQLCFGHLCYNHIIPSSPPKKSHVMSHNFDIVYFLRTSKHMPNTFIAIGETESGKHLVQLWSHDQNYDSLRKTNLPFPANFNHNKLIPIAATWSEFSRHPMLKITYGSLESKTVKEIIWDMTQKKVFRIENNFRTPHQAPLRLENPWNKNYYVKCNKNYISLFKKQNNQFVCIEENGLLCMRCSACSQEFLPSKSCAGLLSKQFNVDFYC